MSSAREGRARQSALTLIGALAASLGIVAVIVWLTIRPANLDRADVDWHQVTSDAQFPVAIADPAFTESDGDWWSNRADVSTGDYPQLYIGFVTPSGGYVAVEQFVDSLPPEVLAELDDVTPQPITIDGTVWTVFDRSTVDDPGNRVLVYLLADIATGGTLMVSGSAPSSEIELVAVKSLTSIGGNE